MSGSEPRGAHPAPDDLQRHAHGDVDAERDAALIAHIASCAECRREIERIRRASAALALSSAPPPDLFDRIRARRASGERVRLPVDEITPPSDPARADDDDVTMARDGHPALIDVHRVADGEVDAASDASLLAHVRACDACRREMEDARRVTAALALASRPPGELAERIAARRASGARVLLPVDVLASPAASEAHRDASTRVDRSTRARTAWWRPGWSGLAIAAMLLLALGVGGEAWRRAAGGIVHVPAPARDTSIRAPGGSRIASRPPAVAPSTTPRSTPVADSALLAIPPSNAYRGAADSARLRWLALDAPARRARWDDLRSALARAGTGRAGIAAPRLGADSLVIALRDSAFDGAALTSAARDAIRAIATTLASRAEYRVGVVARDAARSGTVRDALIEGGVSADRIAVAAHAIDPTAHPDARAEIVVLAPARVPEIR